MKRALFLIPFLLFISCKKGKIEYQQLNGNAFGTTFNISYQDELNRDFTKQIDSLIYVVNKSISTYIPASNISKINAGDVTIVVDAIFKEVFDKSERIYNETNGFFDPTVGVLVNAWGFGPGKELENIDAFTVKKMIENVGFDKVKLINGKIIKSNSDIHFDFNAIGKGYGVDMIGRFFEEKKCKNYRIELGGEIRARGMDMNGNYWRVWLEDPNTDGTRTINNYVRLENKSLATSGNYRKFKIGNDGRKYVHTINAKTGYATESNLLAATVISELDCADVDGYATAFMAMGFEGSKLFLKQHPELQVYLTYVDENGKVQKFSSEGLLVTNRQ